MEIPVEIVRACNAEWYTRKRAKPKAHREALVCDGKVVGFLSPHETKWGWRMGPIFVLPEYRRRGLVRAAYEARRHLLLVAFVADDNPGSRALHEGVGFVRWKRGPGGWFYRRVPS